MLLNSPPYLRPKKTKGQFSCPKGSGAMTDYRYDLVEDPSADFICPICLDLVDEAKQTDCCGNHLCEKCVTCLIMSDSNCPMCQQYPLESHDDLYFRRKVNELQIYCPHNKLDSCIISLSESSANNFGCSWQGEINNLSKHLQICEYEEVICIYGCQEKILRCQKQGHEAYTCFQRPYVCEYCRYEGIYQEILEKHWLVCEKFIVNCPLECGKEGMERNHLPEHLSTECPLEIVSCDFRDIGCEVTIQRQYHQQHLEEASQLHLKLLAHALGEQRKEIKSLKEEATEKDNKIAQLTNRLVSRDKDNSEIIEDLKYQLFRMASIQNRFQYINIKIPSDVFKTKNSLTEIPPSCSFFLMPYGYKMQLHFRVKYHKLQVYSLFIPGEYDHEVEWPFRGTISISLINQISDVDHYEYVFHYTTGSLQGYKPDSEDHIEESVITSSPGMAMSLLKPERVPRYIDRDNIMSFRVTKVTLDKT